MTGFRNLILVTAFLPVFSGAVLAQETAEAPKKDPTVTELKRPGTENALPAEEEEGVKKLQKRKRALDAFDPLEEFKDIGKGVLIEVDDHARPQQAAATDGKTAQSGNVASINAVSIENEMALYNKKQYLDAFQALLPIARKGHAGAQETIGLMFRLGQGVPKDPLKAFQWFNRAAEQGRPLAQHHLSSMYYNGEGVEKSGVKAMMWGIVAEKAYQNDDKKRRAAEDRQAISATLSRRDRDRAEALAHDLINSINSNSSRASSDRR